MDGLLSIENVVVTSLAFLWAAGLVFAMRLLFHAKGWKPSVAIAILAPNLLFTALDVAYWRTGILGRVWLGFVGQTTTGLFYLNVDDLRRFTYFDLGVGWGVGLGDIVLLLYTSYWFLKLFDRQALFAYFAFLAVSCFVYWLLVAQPAIDHGGIAPLGPALGAAAMAAALLLEMLGLAKNKLPK